MTDEDTGVIAAKVAQGLQARGYKTKLYPVAEDRIELIGAIRAECIFNLIEWCGQDIVLAQRAFKYLRELKIPVTGADEARFVLTGDKAALKVKLLQLGLPTPRAQVFTRGDEQIEPLSYPVIVKPTLEHCSTGLGYDSIADDPESLRPIVAKQIQAFHQPVLAEEFVTGREFMVYLLEERGEVRVLPIEEVVFAGGNPLAFQTYETKWDPNDIGYRTTSVVVAKLGTEEKKLIESASVEAYVKLGLRGYARFDARMREGKVYLLETNANPSVYDAEEEITSMEEEVIPGIKFADYLETIVKSAVWHYERGKRI